MNYECGRTKKSYEYLQNNFYVNNSCFVFAGKNRKFYAKPKILLRQRNKKKQAKTCPQTISFSTDNLFTILAIEIEAHG